MYRMVTEVDETCGKILDKLKEQGVLDNTLVIFTTDNGNMHGKKNMSRSRDEHWHYVVSSDVCSPVSTYLLFLKLMPGEHGLAEKCKTLRSPLQLL